ncbi:MAG: hypothetical protein NVSMB29_18870 [Candidatus Dormibacteria bacterium]
MPVHAAAPTFSGRAYAVGVSGVTLFGKPVGNTTVADTGQLPSGGGSVSNGPGTVAVPNLGSVTVTKEQAAGNGSSATASSEISGVLLQPGDVSPLLNAKVLTATTTARACGAAPSASTSVVGPLTVGGQTVTVPVNPPKNTTVKVGTPEAVIATVTFNAQTYDPATNTQSASALVVTFPDKGMLSQLITGTITISHAESDLEGCASAVAAATSTPRPAAVTVPNTGAGSGSAGSSWSMVLVPAGALLLGVALLSRRRRSTVG